VLVVACVLGKTGCENWIDEGTQFVMNKVDPTIDTLMIYTEGKVHEQSVGGKHPYCLLHRNNKLLLPVLEYASNHVNMVFD